MYLCGKKGDFRGKIKKKVRLRPGKSQLLLLTGLNLNLLFLLFTGIGYLHGFNFFIAVHPAAHVHLEEDMIVVHGFVDHFYFGFPTRGNIVPETGFGTILPRVGNPK